jgi:hypothetical protein
MVEVVETRETMGREECRVVESRRCRKGAGAVKSSEMPPSAAEMGSREVRAAETSPKVATAETTPMAAPKTTPTRGGGFSHSE